MNESVLCNPFTRFIGMLLLAKEIDFRTMNPPIIAVQSVWNPFTMLREIVQWKLFRKKIRILKVHIGPRVLNIVNGGAGVAKGKRTFGRSESFFRNTGSP